MLVMKALAHAQDRSGSPAVEAGRSKTDARSKPAIEGMTILEARGHGRQKGQY